VHSDIAAHPVLFIEPGRAIHDDPGAFECERPIWIDAKGRMFAAIAIERELLLAKLNFSEFSS
jgi:hypothetical protein